ncbi:MAG: YlxR family protein [Ruminococcaceae bacterium]|nr:YlxR family protein [Oscillospiraceae bacterium]
MTYVPQRMCIACRQKHPKKDLIRIIKTEQGARLDEQMNLPGRGAYLCRNDACVLNAHKKKALSKHFKMAVPEEIYQQIEEYVHG